ncbi:hypothetical protein Tco_1315715 [Tanacetum coccineum]
MKNKTIEAHPRKVMSSSNKRNHVSLCNANFKHAVKDENSMFVCSTCNGCLLSANHDKGVVTYINDVIKRAKSKYGKSKKMEWKPTGKVFTSVGHWWLPTSRTFTINETNCPLTRITSNPIVPPEETSHTSVITPNPEIKIYRRRTKVEKSGSTISNSPSSSLVNFRTRELTLTPGIISSGFMPNPPSPTSYVPPTKNNWEILFQPMFDEHFNPPPSVASLVPAVIAPKPTDSTGLPSSTPVDQDAPSPSSFQTPPESQSLVISPSVEEPFHDIEVAHLDNDPFFGVPIPEPSSKESFSKDGIPTNVHSVNQPPKHLRKWTKDHPMDNVTSDPSRPVSTRHQL